jgi:predicted RNase H-like HicB family nuclease
MMKTATSVTAAGYRLPLVIEPVEDAYQATSPALPGLLVLADTPAEVITLAPGVAQALLEAMQDLGLPLPAALPSGGWLCQ